MPTSDEDLHELQDTVQGLREELAAERAKAEASARELNNDVAAAQLNAERVRLETELAAARDLTTVQSDAGAAASAPLAAAHAAMEAAQAQQAAAEELRTADAEALAAANDTSKEG